jgi:ribosome assembly protein 4
MTMCSHTKAVTCVKWGGEGRLYSASRDTNINVWDAKVRKDKAPPIVPCNWEMHHALNAVVPLRGE